MNLRLKQTEATREMILDAAEDLIFSDAAPASITMQAIADAAGVSHRTMYRHFEGRQALMESLGKRIDARTDADTSFTQPTTFDEWVGGVDATMHYGAAFREQLRRVWLVSVATSVWRRDRDKAYYAMFRQRFPHLDEEIARQDFAALRHLYGAANVVLIGERFELSPEQTSEAVGRAVDALVVDIEKRDQQAAAD